MLARKSHLALAAALVALILPLPVLAAPRTQGGLQRAGAAASGQSGSHLPTASSAPLSLLALPALPIAGQQVLLHVENPPPEATDYRWTVDGASPQILDTGSSPSATVRFPASGAHSVRVRADGLSSARTGSLVLIVAPAPAAVHAPAPHPRLPSETRPLQLASAGPTRTHARDTVIHLAAGDPGVTIADFQFTPASITVQAGDTVTWTNNGPSAHTATAQDGSFNTGVLQPGQSASHTFTQAGTFSYFCSIHPFMHGTVVVQGPGGGSSSSSGAGTGTSSGSTAGTGATGAGSSTGSGTAATGTNAPGNGGLPMTGLDLIVASAIGLLMSGIGISVRRALHR